MTPVFSGDIQNGVLVLDDATGETFTIVSSARFMEWVRGLEGKRAEITLDRERRIRSDSQHGLERIWTRVIGNHCGISPDEIHRLAKKRAGFVEYRDFGQGPEEIIKSQRDMTTVELLAVMQELELMAEFNGLRLPQPHELAEMRNGRAG